MRWSSLIIISGTYGALCGIYIDSWWGLLIAIFGGYVIGLAFKQWWPTK